MSSQDVEKNDGIQNAVFLEWIQLCIGTKESDLRRL